MQSRQGLPAHRSLPSAPSHSSKNMLICNHCGSSSNLQEGRSFLTNCKHLFCGRCAEEFFQNSENACPFCRQKGIKFLELNISSSVRKSGKYTALVGYTPKEIYIACESAIDFWMLQMTISQKKGWQEELDRFRSSVNQMAQRAVKQKEEEMGRLRQESAHMKHKLEQYAEALEHKVQKYKGVLKKKNETIQKMRRSSAGGSRPRTPGSAKALSSKQRSDSREMSSVFEGGLPHQYSSFDQDPFQKRNPLHPRSSRDFVRVGREEEGLEEGFEFRTPMNQERKVDGGNFSNFFKMPKYTRSEHFF